MGQEETFFIYELLALPTKSLPAVFMYTFSRFEKGLHAALMDLDPIREFWQPTWSAEDNWAALKRLRDVPVELERLFRKGWAVRASVLAGQNCLRTHEQWEELIAHWEHLVQGVR